MTFRLLVIDDELAAVEAGGKTRREYYDCLKPQFEVIFLEKLQNLSGAVRSHAIHAVLMDFVLDKWGTDARTVLKALGGEFPVALISRHWGPSFENLRLTLSAHEEVAQLFTWEDLEENERRGLVGIWLDSVIRKSRDLALMTLSPNDSIKILQISDLQFGSPLPAAFAIETQLAAQFVRRQFAGPPHFVALSGDIAEAGLPSEFSKARTWLREFTSKIDPLWDDRHFWVIPGNHDVCLPLGMAGRIDVKKREMLATPVADELKRFSLAPYREFARQLGADHQWEGESQYWTCGRYRQLGFILFGCNTCEDLDDWSKPTRNLVDKTLAEMFSSVADLQSDAPDALVVGLMHHPLFCEDPSEVIANPGVLYKSLSDRPSAIALLNGHFHGEACTFQDRDGIGILEITASTVTKGEKARPADTGRGFNLIELERLNGRVSGIKVTSCRYERTGLSIAKISQFDRDTLGRLIRGT